MIFAAAMRKAGNRIEFISPPGAIHTYMFKDASLHAETRRAMDAFFRPLGLLNVDVKPASKTGCRL